MFFLSVCVAEDPANRAREEKKRFRSRQTASKQGTNHSDSYDRRIDLPRSNAVAREARTFAYVPLRLGRLFLFFFSGTLKSFGSKRAQYFTDHSISQTVIGQPRSLTPIP